MVSQHVDVQIENIPVHPGLHVDVVTQVMLGAVKLGQQRLHIHQVPAGAVPQSALGHRIQLVHVLLVNAHMGQRNCAIGVWTSAP